jgi:erythromycin esterase-like protein
MQEVVDGIPEDRRVVLLGESTHGTEEFYRVREAVTKRLIEERGFTAVLFEADWPAMQAANEYIHRRRTSPYQDERRFPEWMWHNQCMADFFEWCKRREPDGTPQLFGIDCYSLFESKRAVVAFLDEHDPEFAAEVTDRLAYLDRFESGFEYGDAMVNGSFRHIGGHIQDTLTRIQARLQWGSDKYSCSEVDRLSAEQNCEVIIAADEYYRKQVSEPAGSRASWNARDQHMTTSLLRIQAHLDDPKMVVWAHNSHVGDVTATQRGGVEFERNETWNLGQMTRATFGADKVWIVGQYTHGGHVTAAPKWGAPHCAFALKPAVSGE